MSDPGTEREPIPPALSAEEWADQTVRRDNSERAVCIMHTGALFGVWTEGPAGLDTVVLEDDAIPALIALANAALPDSDPRKITREVVELLRAAAYCCRQDDYYIAAHLNEGDADATREEGLANRYEAAADALASYLPA